ncbi:integrase, catalytic region, zinc finger, CCHC-type containing protein, partial [Tanacetum coccineum]
MSMSNTHQQSLADASSETRPPMLERELSLLLILKHQGCKKEEDLRGDDLKHYEAEIEAMNLILISIPNDIYNSVDACTTAKAMWKRVKLLMRVTNDAGNIHRTLRTASSGTIVNVQCYNCGEKGHYARNCPNPRMEEIEELNANICLMARIQPANFDSDAGPTYDSAFLNEVQTPSTSYVNLLFAKDNQEQKYPKQPKIINNTIGDDQIDRNIIFDEPNDNVNSISVEDNNNAQQSYELEQLARDVYKKAEKQQIIAKIVQQQNTVLTKQLKLYKEKVRDLEQQRDKLELYVVELKRQTVELQKTQSILKRQMSEDEDKYHDIVLDFEAKAKKNVDVMLKLGYANPYTLKKAISHNLKLYDASWLEDSKIHMNVRDTEDILDDATKSQIKMKDPIAIEKKQNVCTIDYKKLNPLYEDFVPQRELSAEQKYFHSSFISSENSSNASSSYSSSKTKTTVTPMPNNNMQDEIEKIQRDSIEIQEGMQKRINFLENDVQRCQKQSLDFELQLKHEKERRKCESSLKNICETSWISKMEKLESENVSLEFQVQSLIKERDNVNQKTYAYADVRAQNQDLLITISELKAKLKNVKK